MLGRANGGGEKSDDNYFSLTPETHWQSPGLCSTDVTTITLPADRGFHPGSLKTLCNLITANAIYL